MTYEEFCVKLKRLRKVKNVTVQEFAKAIGEKPSHIAGVENGKIKMCIEEFLKWCTYLEISPRGFFDSAYPFKSAHYKRVCEMIEDLDEDDFEMMRRIVNVIYHYRKE